ncbi:tetratricopeptide repeat protein [Sphingobacterium alkalisoli]|uniref:Tetratricopeptide repeat protein n=1 Tax=Sphingobacterium alkalisoli TaxID=1874115 RepID=A0A4U0GUG4_9SPHI|nr:tetratricopeptide repeat protein [Sphingobacterium alkalisoli]TJY61352.1 tetratricopeptide repeat protein [Sphingobacterium alkalisoli]GGH30783.1 hypothetical protein GCM10011418_43120 [Sphingobacterium alkalisoli]
MKKITFAFLIQAFICCICWSCSDEPLDKDADIQPLTEVLSTRVDYGKDTAALEQHVGALSQQAAADGNDLLLWAYYLRLADGYSIAYDGVNDRSDAYFAKARLLARDIGSPALSLVNNIRNGYYLFTYRKISEAIPYFLQASVLLEEVALEDVPQAAQHLDFVAQFFSYIGDHKKAIASLERGLPFAVPLSRQQINMYNAMAVYLKRDKQVDRAADYFLEALEAARQAKDTLWMGIVLGNLADIKYENGEVEEAIADLKQNIAYSLHYKDNLDAMRSLIHLSEIYIQENQYAQAKATVEQAIPFLEDKPYFLLYKLKVSKLLADLAQHAGDDATALAQLNRTVRLQEALAQREDVEQVQRSYWRWKGERDQNALAAIVAEEKQGRIYLQIGLFILFLLTVIGGLLVARYRLQMKTQAILVEKRRVEESMEKQQMGEEMVVLRTALEEFTDTLKINDLLIQKLKDENRKGDQVDSRESLENLLDSHLMTDARWLKFKAVFDRVYDGFLSRLKKVHPQLTEGDLRIIALQKLELSNRSISEILGISVDGVKKAKQRLKKKLDVDIYISVSL